MTRRTFFGLGIAAAIIGLSARVHADPSTKGDKGVGPGKPADKQKDSSSSGPDPNKTPSPKDRK